MSRSWMVFALVLLVLLGYGCNSGGDEVDGDQESSEQPAGLTLGMLCTSPLQCSGGICNADDGGDFCTMACAADSQCQEQLANSCCMRVDNQNICLVPSLCPNTPDGDSDLPDGDFDYDLDLPDMICSPDELKCDENSVVRCNSVGTRWLPQMDCSQYERCENGACIMITDGDADETTENDESDTDGFACGDPSNRPDAILRQAERLFQEDESTPANAAEIAYSDNPAFEDDTYVRLNADDYDQEMVFEIDIDKEFEYVFMIDFVCGRDWGEASLFLDDGTEPIPLADGSDRINLFCNPGGNEEKPIRNIDFQPLCIPPNDRHKLRVRVVGKNADSNGYTIGVDYISLLPYTSPEE